MSLISASLERKKMHVFLFHHVYHLNFSLKAVTRELLKTATIKQNSYKTNESLCSVSLF